MCADIRLPPGRHSLGRVTNAERVSIWLSCFFGFTLQVSVEHSQKVIVTGMYWVCSSGNDFLGVFQWQWLLGYVPMTMTFGYVPMTMSFRVCSRDNDFLVMFQWHWLSGYVPVTLTFLVCSSDTDFQSLFQWHSTCYQFLLAQVVKSLASQTVFQSVSSTVQRTTPLGGYCWQWRL